MIPSNNPPATRSPDLFDWGKANRNATYLEMVDTHHEKRQQILALIIDAGPSGRTLDELASHYDVPANQISGRVTELKKRGLVRHTKDRRRTRAGSTASVIVATSILNSEDA